MSSEIVRALLYSGGAALLAVAGGAIAALRPPTARVRSYVQHLAGGLIMAAVTVELLPDVMHRQRPVWAALGFALGAAAMLALRQAAQAWGEGSEVSWRMIATVLVDVTIDGVILGVLLTAGQRASQRGALVTIGLASELFALGLATSSEIVGAGRSRIAGISTGAAVGLGLFAGALLGALLLSGLSGGLLEAFLAFGAAVFLYLVVEELLVEAHEVPETPLATTMFFVGFLVLLLIDMAFARASA